ncbi:MAG: hypothetical protein MJ211_01785 [Bacteroidales bacterium]|nr:hypothetical protein [Bacteroidales bacterium]
MKIFRNYLVALGVMIFALNACNSIPIIQEQNVGPYFTVCVESYAPYRQTFNIIDSLKNELKKIDVETESDFAIFYERNVKTELKFHSIVGCILNSDAFADSSLIIRLKRNNFMTREIGETKCMVIEVPFQDFNTELRRNVGDKFDQYIKDNNYLPIPNGENGITEIYKNGNIKFAAEIKPSK